MGSHDDISSSTSNPPATWANNKLETKAQKVARGFTQNLHVETCTQFESHSGEGSSDGKGRMDPKDYTYYLLFVTLYLLVLILIYMFFFKTELRRTIAGSVRRQTVSFTRTAEKDVESLLPGESSAVRAISPMRRLIATR